MIAYDEARQRILAACQPLAAGTVAVAAAAALDRATGCALPQTPGDGLATAFIMPMATASGAKAARSATLRHPLATTMITERVDRGSSGPAQVGVQEIDFDTGEASRIVNRNTPE